jgi:hypothetical protein
VAGVEGKPRDSAANGSDGITERGTEKRIADFRRREKPTVADSPNGSEPCTCSPRRQTGSLRQKSSQAACGCKGKMADRFDLVVEPAAKAQCISGRYKYLAIHVHEPARQRARELANTPEFVRA